jgi:hypothetical protein
MDHSKLIPPPLILELIAQVKDAAIFSKFDVRQGYNNVCIKKGDKHKAAFKTKYGFFKPLVMFFGLRNSPSTFQAMMDQEFRDIIKEHRLLGTEIIIYMDDILVASTSLKGHRAAVHTILDRLETLDLYLKPEKCIWEASQVDYLGLILEKGGNSHGPHKDKRHCKLAHTNYSETSPILFGLLQLLSTIHLPFFPYHMTPE